MLKSRIFKKDKFLPLCRIPNNLMTLNAQAIFRQYHFYHYTSNILLFPDCSSKNWIVLLDFSYALLSKHNSAYWCSLLCCSSCYNDFSRTFADFANNGANAIIHFASFQIIINVKIMLPRIWDVYCTLTRMFSGLEWLDSWVPDKYSIGVVYAVCVCSVFGLSSSFCGQSRRQLTCLKKAITSCHEKKLPPTWKKWFILLMKKIARGALSCNRILQLAFANSLLQHKHQQQCS